MSDLRIAFCITCKDRTPHLQQTLPKNLADASTYANAKFIVLDYNSSDHLLSYLGQHHQKDIASGRLVLYSYRDHPTFRMAHAKNMAHRLGIHEGADVLVNMDADNFSVPGYCEYLNAEFQNENIFMWSRMVKEGPERMPRGISGRIAVSKQTFLISGGYDEKFATWGPDDKDFHSRLRRLGFKRREHDPLYLGAVLHNNKLRFREYPQAATDSDSAAFDAVMESDVTVANFGNAGCGVVFKNFNQLDRVHLKPFPTRLFGIGMHKTATTSLNTALKRLGFNSAHWINAHWAKAIYDEMLADGRSHTLERHYALCDLPLPLLFQKLDETYPGSKFILTTRADDKWLASVEAHWSFEKNPFRHQWSVDPFTHRVHNALYGRKTFDAATMLERYRRHNFEVIDYFSEQDRLSDLLVMRMDCGAGWPELCKFLGCPIPDSPYPRDFVTAVAGSEVKTE